MKLIKKLISVILVLGILISAVPSFAAPTFGTVSKEMQTLGTTTIIHAVSTIQDGQPVAVCLVGGSTYGVLHVIDINKEKIIKSITIEDGGRPTYGLADSKGRVHLIDGNKVRVYDPKDQTLYTTTGIPTTWSGSSNGVIELDGKFYGATSSYGRIFSYEVGGKCTIVADLRNYTDINTLTGLAGVNGYIYTGGKYVPEEGEGTYFYKVNPKTGAVTKLSNPENKAVRSYGYMTDLGKYAFVQVTFMDGTGSGYFYDTEAGVWLDKTLQINANVMSQEIYGKKYFIETTTHRMHSIDVNTLETENLGYDGGNYFRASGLPFTCDAFGDEVCFLQSQFYGNLYVYTTTLGKTKKIDVDLIPADEPHRISRTGFDGDVYVTAFQGINGADYDPDTKTYTTYGMGQGEGIVARGSKVYFGVYPGAAIHELDTSKPYGSGNPRTIYDISGNQDRPFGMDLMDNYLLVGTLPMSGTYNGAFTVIDLNDYSAVEYTTDSLGFPTHSIMTITHDDRYAYLGTSVCSGSGTVPAQGGGLVIKFDMQTRKVVKSYELKSFAGYTNVKSVHGLRISPYNGMLYGTTHGIDFIMDPSDLSLKKTNVYNADTVITNASNISQIWHEHYMQFYGGYLFRTNQVIDPETLSIVATAGTSDQFAGIYDDTAYYVDGTCTVYSMPITLSETTNKVTDFMWDSFEPGEGAYRVEGDVPAVPSIGKTLDSNDVSMRIYAGAGEGKNPTQSLDSTSGGMVFQLPKTVKDGSFVVGMDFYVPNENIEATLLAPVGSEDGMYQVPVYLGKGGDIYVLGKYNRRYDIGKVEIGKWNKIALLYNNSTTAFSSVTVYLNGEHKQAWDTHEQKYYSGVHGYNFHKQPMKEFDVRVVARTTDEEYENEKSYVARDEYLEIDNVFITSDTSVVEYGTVLLNTELIDNKTVNLTFNKEYSGNLVGKAVQNLDGTTAATVSGQSVLGKNITLTLSTELPPLSTYSIDLSDISDKAVFKTGIEAYAIFDGISADAITYTGSKANSISDGAMIMWAKYGDGSIYTNEVADHQHGEEVDFVFPTSVSNDEVLLEFDYMRAFDTVTRISPRYENQTRYYFGPSLDIDKNGNLSIKSISENGGSKLLGNVGAYEWHKISMKIVHSSVNGVQFTVYLDGINLGTFTNGNVEQTRPISYVAFYNTAYTSEEGKAISTIRSDRRAEYCMVDNMLLTSDLSMLNTDVVVTKAETISLNKVRFTCNKNVKITDENIYINGFNITKVESDGSNVFDVTVSENFVINGEYFYTLATDDIFESRFTAKHPGTLDNFDLGSPSYAVDAGWSHQKTSRDGKFGYTEDKAFGWSPHHRNGVGSGYNNISKGSGAITWFEGDSAFKNDKLVVSADFMRGSERVGFWPFAFVKGSSGDSIAKIEITPSGEFRVAGNTYDTGIKPLEWHNVTMHLYITDSRVVFDVYFDGKLVVDNLLAGTTETFKTLKTIGEFETLTDEGLKSYNNVAPERNDIVIIDNMYIGRDFDYKTSDILLTETENGVDAYTGAVSRNNPAITALYDNNGALKDVSIRTLTADKLSNEAIDGALDMADETKGDTVKFFVVDSLLNLRPISNLLTKTVE